MASSQSRVRATLADGSSIRHRVIEDSLGPSKLPPKQAIEMPLGRLARRGAIALVSQVRLDWIE